MSKHPRKCKCDPCIAGRSNNLRKFGQPVRACYKKYMDLIPDDGSVIRRIYHARFNRVTDHQEIFAGADPCAVRYDHVAIAVLANGNIVWKTSRCNWMDQYSKSVGLSATVGHLLKQIATNETKGVQVESFNLDSFNKAANAKELKEWFLDLVYTLALDVDNGCRLDAMEAFDDI